MGVFDFFSAKSGETGYGDSSYSDTPTLGIEAPLSYNECQAIYENWPLGKRVASALINFALSAPRTIEFKGLPDECIDRFNKFAELYKVEEVVKKVAVNARIYGLAGVYVAHDSVPCNKPLTFKDLDGEGEISFNIQDPLNLNGAFIDQDPLSTDYQKLTQIRINSNEVAPQRVHLVFNDLHFYLKWVPSTYNFGTQSVYQNMRNLITSWTRAIVGLERLTTKAGSIVYKSRDAGNLVNSFTINSTKKSLDLIRSMQNDGILSVEKDSAIEFFTLNGVSEVEACIAQINQAILMALSDTPASILLDKELAQGFGNGEEDMKAILMAVDNYRRLTLKGIYDFLDRFVLYKAFDSAYLEDLKSSYKELKSLSISDLREKIIQNYKFEWGNLYPENEATKVANAATKLDNYLKLKELGANLADIEESLNSDNIFINEMTLEEANLESEGEFEEAQGSSQYSDVVNDENEVNDKEKTE